MGQVKAGFGAKAGKLKGDGGVSNLYRKVICFGQKEGRAIGRIK
jgi:hypothetical protein